MDQIITDPVFGHMINMSVKNSHWSNLLIDFYDEYVICNHDSHKIHWCKLIDWVLHKMISFIFFWSVMHSFYKRRVRKSKYIVNIINVFGRWITPTRITMYICIYLSGESLISHHHHHNQSHIRVWIDTQRKGCTLNLKMWRL